MYSSGKVFDGLGTGRLDTENFLRSGALDGVTSRSDLALLEDFRDVSEYILENRDRPITSDYVRAVNSQITRSGPLNLGAYRTGAQNIGVTTPYGRHEPQPSSDVKLQQLIDKAMALPGPREQALELFVEIAKAQPFEDGNKRTALFVANSLLIREPQPELLVVPIDESSPYEASKSAVRFNDFLAQAYVLYENDGIKQLLRTKGFVRPTPDRAATRDSEQRGIASARRVVRRPTSEPETDGPLTDDEFQL